MQANNMTIEENIDKLTELKREYIHSYLCLVLNIFHTYPSIKTLGLQSIKTLKIKLSRFNTKTVNLAISGKEFEKSINFESFLMENDLKITDIDIIPRAIYQDDYTICQFIWDMSEHPIMMENKFTRINEEIINDWIEKLKTYDMRRVNG